jgi:hypothetical protein
VNIITLTSFEDELSLIKLADAATWAPPKIAPVAAAAKPIAKAWKHAPAHPPEVMKHLGNLFKSYGAKAISKHGAAAPLGALGAGLTLMHGGLKEWDSRAAENRALAKTPADQHEAAKQYVDAARLHRLKRLGVNTALAGGTGALVGHYGGKAVRSLSESASKGMAQNLKPALEEALAKGHSRGLQEGSKGVFWKALNPFKK